MRAGTTSAFRRFHLPPPVSATMRFIPNIRFQDSIAVPLSENRLNLAEFNDGQRFRLLRERDDQVVLALRGREMRVAGSPQDKITVTLDVSVMGRLVRVRVSGDFS